jgi:hypothetical protein
MQFSGRKVFASMQEDIFFILATKLLVLFLFFVCRNQIIPSSSRDEHLISDCLNSVLAVSGTTIICCRLETIQGSLCRSCRSYTWLYFALSGLFEKIICAFQCFA